MKWIPRFPSTNRPFDMSTTATPSPVLATRPAKAAAFAVLPQRCRLCGAESEPAPNAICEHCLGPLEPLYPKSRALPDREEIARRAPSLWRYKEWLPFTGDPVHSRETGFTPLIEVPRLADKLGVARAWVKNDSVAQPTLSFKDRVVTTAINAAHAFGLTTIGCASTGNLANAVAAHAARAEECTDMALRDAYARLRAFPLVGAWTAAEVGLRALGDPDVVSVGDYHLCHAVCHALAAEPRGTDERMLELLAPFAGYRARVIRLIEVAGIHAPRRGPRYAPRSIAEI